MIHAYYPTAVDASTDCSICLLPLTSQVVGHAAIHVERAEEESELPERVDRVFQFLAEMNAAIDGWFDKITEKAREVPNDEVVIPIDQVLHPVHTYCISEWMKNQHTCPECRQAVIDLDTPTAVIKAKIARTITWKRALVDMTKVLITGATLASTIDSNISPFNWSRAKLGIMLCTTALSLAAGWNAFQKTPWRGYPSFKAVATAAAVTVVAAEALSSLLGVF